MRLASIILCSSFLLAACVAPTAVPAQPTQPAATDLATAAPAPTDTETEPGQTEGLSMNNRVDFEETIPRQSIPIDGIRPVYEPVFAPASEAPLTDDELVLGVALEGEAKAYPISVLRFREIVNDEMAGIPTLVTW